MPIVDGKELTPEEAIAQGRCPETGLELRLVDIAGHIAHLWPHGFDPNDKTQDEGRKRKKLLEDYARAHPKL